MGMSYDQKCYDLAITFLADQEPKLTAEELAEQADILAAEIQTTIEDFLNK